MAEDDDAPPIEVVDPEMRQILGMFDLPAFARRGQDLEHALRRLHERIGQERDTRLEMVRLRLRQWAAVAEGPEAELLVFGGTLDRVRALAGAQEPCWSVRGSSRRRRRVAARDLVASAERFNRNWVRYIDDVNLEVLNRQVEHYNRYYLLEKECVLHSARLAARLFTPKRPVTADDLFERHPLLPALEPHDERG
jgi:hypothetical protein